MVCVVLRCISRSRSPKRRGGGDVESEALLISGSAPLGTDIPALMVGASIQCGSGRDGTLTGGTDKPN